MRLLFATSLVLGNRIRTRI